LSGRKVRWILGITVVVVLGLLLRGGLWLRNHVQVADSNYDTRVAAPAYSGPAPVVCVDAAHHNFATINDRYAPFASLIRNDGYAVVPNGAPFTIDSLRRCQILVVANALGARFPVLPSSSHPAFSQGEIESVREWVNEGGALLLVADHEPAGAASADLAAKFGVEMSAGRTLDFIHFDSASGKPSWIVFTPANSGLGDHPILRGRSDAERVSRVVTFAGQSLRGKLSHSKLLILGDSAFDGTGHDTTLRPAAGRAQALAFPYGRGRVVVTGEAAMLTAQVTGAGKVRFGMNIPGNDDRQFALNIMHWLSGLLPETSGQDSTLLSHSAARR
jgi:hypothetical protein